METRARLKRRLLSGVVEENLALIEGRARASRRPRSSHRLAWALAFLAGAGVAGGAVILAGARSPESAEAAPRSRRPPTA